LAILYAALRWFDVPYYGWVFCALVASNRLSDLGKSVRNTERATAYLLNKLDELIDAQAPLGGSGGGTGMRHEQ
jgi:hypothetical protein